ncbi:four helix bundle protein [Flaviaesturariibacter flavus]|uniref:Four helix bundle protein n=1 Tax=Flaviaesturariibacter flavus TaxID=2502780 RepID=A0A4R1BKE4_9BACT|nr:four helix bundle protein [Flaviaesturariibacter flavus]TCJ17841.1 four helix bundle protein [Flaviaesturariibacter flavus]
MTPILYPANPLLQQTFEFALGIIAYCEELKGIRQYEMSRQLFKSGTSIHSQVREGQKPESSADFIHKFKIGEKEASETEGWLLMCKFSPGFPNPDKLLQRLPSIQKMLNSSILTAKRKTTRHQPS